MATRQRKVERHRLKRRAKQRERQIVKLRTESRTGSNAHPLYACTVNLDWREKGIASIFMARRVGTGRVTMASFLVDRLAMGLKDAWGRTDIPTSEFDKQISRFSTQLATGPLNLGTAKHLVYGGIDLARELGFRLPRRYERWTAILGPLPEDELPDMSLFLDDGKIFLVCSRRDLEARLVGTTPEKFLARPDVTFIMGDEDFTLVDDEEDECDELTSQLEQAMVERARQWCFANGQVPHPLLPELVGAFLEAITQSIPSDLDPDEEIEALPEATRDEMARQAFLFLSASFHHDPAALEAAMAQFHGFMGSIGSPQELFKTLGLEDD